MRRRHSEHQTRRHRLIGHDYSEPGYYFVTFGTYEGRDHLGTIERQKVILSPTGEEVSRLLEALPSEYEQVEIDCFALMPNHVHVLIYLAIYAEPISLTEIVRVVKGRSAAFHRNLAQDRTRLWHKGFHDEIVRNDAQLDTVRRYIAENPLRWRNDDFWT